MIDTSLFPYENHPFRLEFGEKKNPTICYFSCVEHLDKYLNRYKLDKRKVKIDYRDGEPTSTRNRIKDKVRQGTAKTDSGSATTTRRSTKSVDSGRNTSRSIKSNQKPKPKPDSKPKRKPKSK